MSYVFQEEIERAANSLLKVAGLVTRSKASIALRNQKKRMSRGFKAGIIDRLNPSGWGSGSTIDQDIKAGGDRLLSRVKDLVQNSDYAKNAIRLFENNSIPPGGMTLQVKGRDDDDQLLKDENRIIERCWGDFSLAENFNVNGRLDRYRTELLAMRHLVRDGEFLGRLVISKNYKYGVAIQMLNPRVIDHGYNAELSNGNHVSMGIEFDVWGKIAAFYFKKKSASNGYWSHYQTYERERVSAEHIIYDHDPDFADQSRGVTHLAQSLIALKKIDGYEDYGFTAAQVAAAKVVYYEKTTEGGPNVSPQDYLAERNEDGTIETDSSNNPIEDLEPGTATELPEGWKANAIDWNFPSAMHDPYMKRALKGRGAGMGLDYPSFANDWEGVNYTSSRTAQLESRKNYIKLQTIFASGFCKKIYDSFLLMGITTDEIKIDIERINYFSGTAVYITGVRWRFVDPMKEAAAYKLLLDNKMMSYRRYYAEQGLDFAEEMADIAEDTDIMVNDYGITPGDGSTVTEVEATPDDETDNKPGNGKGEKEDYKILMESQDG